MQGIMNDKVGRVAGNESTKQNPPLHTKGESKDAPEKKSYDDRHHRRHHQSVFIPGKFVMDAVHIILQLLLELTRSMEMKNKAMDEVFQQREGK